ncbi:unnamed protein product [Protopolystoma xenopodis]|uniref:Uncharacterized protein n=1 Tax=Protopolystoma xenopodis TaxID=117903 RepID=A0A448WW56_9PLAT|nr:unnamed protein product [Protopolystoma xenopodis]
MTTSSSNRSWSVTEEPLSSIISNPVLAVEGTLANSLLDSDSESLSATESGLPQLTNINTTDSLISISQSEILANFSTLKKFVFKRDLPTVGISESIKTGNETHVLKQNFYDKSGSQSIYEQYSLLTSSETYERTHYLGIDERKEYIKGKRELEMGKIKVDAIPSVEDTSGLIQERIEKDHDRLYDEKQGALDMIKNMDEKNENSTKLCIITKLEIQNEPAMEQKEGQLAVIKNKDEMKGIEETESKFDDTFKEDTRNLELRRNISVKLLEMAQESRLAYDTTQTKVEDDTVACEQRQIEEAEYALVDGLSSVHLGFKPLIDSKTSKIEIRDPRPIKSTSPVDFSPSASFLFRSLSAEAYKKTPWQCLCKTKSKSRQELGGDTTVSRLSASPTCSILDEEPAIIDKTSDATSWSVASSEVFMSVTQSEIIESPLPSLPQNPKKMKQEPHQRKPDCSQRPLHPHNLQCNATDKESVIDSHKCLVQNEYKPIFRMAKPYVGRRKSLQKLQQEEEITKTSEMAKTQLGGWFLQKREEKLEGSDFISTKARDECRPTRMQKHWNPTIKPAITQLSSLSIESGEHKVRGRQDQKRAAAARAQDRHWHRQQVCL